MIDTILHLKHLIDISETFNKKYHIKIIADEKLKWDLNLSKWFEFETPVLNLVAASPFTNAFSTACVTDLENVAK